MHSPDAVLVLDGYAMAVIKKNQISCTHLIQMQEIRWEFMKKVELLLF